MEGGSRGPCRLVASASSGRIRWCVGHERKWTVRLRYLAVVPLLLLPFTLLAAFLAGQHRTDVGKALRWQPETSAKGDKWSDGSRQTALADGTSRLSPAADEAMADRWDGAPLNSNSKSNSTTIFWERNLSPERVREVQAGLMRKSMDVSVNPCEDFYKFACGNWERSNPIPADKAGYDTFEKLRENLDVVLRMLLSSEDAVSVDSNDAIAKAKNMYRSCMDHDKLKERGPQPLLQLLEEFGGWPVLSKHWREDRFDWLDAVARLRLYNNDILISEWVGPDIKNSSEYVIQIDQASLGLPTRDYFLLPANEKYLVAYRTYFTMIATLLGAPLDTILHDAVEVIQFEKDIAQITAAPEQRKNVSELYERTTVNGLATLLPKIDWLRYLRTIFDRDITGLEPVVCYARSYLNDLGYLLARTPKRIQANYVLWRFVRHRVNNLDDRFQEAKQRIYKILFGREKPPPRWQTCVSQVNANMGMAVGYLFVKEYFDETSKMDTIKMTVDIRQSFRHLLNASKWIDDDTKRTAKSKLDNMLLRIGYPDSLINRTDLSGKYRDISIEPDKYFENTLSTLRHLTRSEHDRLGTVVNRTIWSTAPAIVNAYYSRNKNQIMFPAGILQPPFYHRHFPKALNYGGIGVVIGHEITHGFDDKGRLFDKEGNLQKWWTDDAIEGFHSRAKCLIDQYDKFVVNEVNMQVDGSNTQGENIADNGGVKQSFRAYKKWLQDHGNEETSLPGLNLTSAQLFFVNFAQIWCGVMRPEATRSKLKTAVHSPGRYRVIGTLSNLEEFSREFNCDRASPMNPLHKCTVW